MSLPRNSVYISADAPLEKMIFPLLVGYQLQIAYLLWMGPHVHFPLLSGLKSCRLYAHYHTLSKFLSVSILMFMEDTASLEFSITSVPYKLSASSSAYIPLVLERRDLMNTFHLDWVGQVSHFLHLVQVWVSVFIPIFYKIFHWCGLSETLGIAIYHQELFSCYVPLTEKL